MNWPVVAYAPIPATIPIIAIKPLKRSAPEFITLKEIHINLLNNLNERGKPNDLIFAKITKNQASTSLENLEEARLEVITRILCRQRRIERIST
tara:strand:+ start:24 stop:305 length:282 start_codon:yes stop_codon:yes gene_type:complete